MEEGNQNRSKPQVKTLEVIVTVFAAFVMVFIFIKIVFF
jgi:hypothetical protein